METTLMKIDFTDDQVKLIKSQIAPKATNDELSLFLYQCKRTGLDPLTRQIYAIHRNAKDANGNYVERMTIQTSIDGFRVIAERSGDYAGQDEPLFQEENGKLIKATVTVYRFRGDTRYPAAVGVAYWNEYCQTGRDGKPMGLWAKMPHTMLAKVAEALALRKAYPQDLSGLYTNDEMQQADKTEDATFDEVPTPEEKQMLRSLVGSSTLSEEKKISAYESIEKCMDYKTYEKIQHRLEDCQMGYDEVPNPNSTDAKNIVKKIAGKKPQTEAA
jgi:phage recombination protein Bet